MKAYYKKYPNADNRVSVGSGEESRLSLRTEVKIQKYEANMERKQLVRISLPIPDGVTVIKIKLILDNGTLNPVQVAGKLRLHLKLMLIW